jgi:N6-L-threonylcarbamoyladenine synthase
MWYDSQQAHALTPFLTQNHHEIEFPFLSLLVSGGHTMLVLVSSSSEFKILANTADKPLG